MSKLCHQSSDQKKHYICKQLLNSTNSLTSPIFHQSLLYVLQSRHCHRYDFIGIMLQVHKGFSHTNDLLLHLRKRQASISTLVCGMIPRVYLGLTSSSLNDTPFSCTVSSLDLFTCVFFSFFSDALCFCTQLTNLSFWC